MELVQGGGGEFVGQSVEPVVDVVGVELLELDGADLRYQMLVDENPVRLDSAAVEIPGS